MSKRLRFYVGLLFVMFMVVNTQNCLAMPELHDNEPEHLFLLPEPEVIWCGDFPVIHLNLYRNGKYTLNIAQSDIEMTSKSLIFSAGDYTISSETILLTDSYFGIKMRGLIQENQCLFSNGFICLLENKVFLRVLDGNPPKHPRSTETKHIDSLSKEPAPKISEAVYLIYEDAFEPLPKIELMQNSQYLLYAGKAMMSAGIWNQNMSVLTLYDTTLHYDMELLITGDSLVPMRLPIGMMDFILRNKESLDAERLEVPSPNVEEDDKTNYIYLYLGFALLAVLLIIIMFIRRKYTGHGK